MATTTNFGWETPDDTDLVKDGALAIRTLGSSIDTSLVDLKGGTTGQVLSKASNTDMDFTWVAQDDSNAIQNALLTTTGDTIYASAASTPARLGIGTTGQVLTVSGGVPVWATPAGGGGKVLQVVSATTTTAVSNTTTSYVDSGLSASITPSATSSKILILTQQMLQIGGTEDSQASLKLLRGSTQIQVPGNYEVYLASRTQSTQIKVVANLAYLDSPSTTSSTTYKTQIVKNGGTSVAAQGDSETSSIILLEIGA